MSEERTAFNQAQKRRATDPEYAAEVERATGIVDAYARATSSRNARLSEREWQIAQAAAAVALLLRDAAIEEDPR